jgi:hypothetical protein
VVINAARRFAKVSNVQRLAYINTVLSAVIQNLNDNKGKFLCSAGDIPTTTKYIGSNTSSNNILTFFFEAL